MFLNGEIKKNEEELCNWFLFEWTLSVTAISWLHAIQIKLWQINLWCCCFLLLQLMLNQYFIVVLIISRFAQMLEVANYPNER